MRTATVEPPAAPAAQIPPLLINVDHVAELTGLGARTIWRFAGSGQLPAPLKIGGRRLWSRDQIENWIAAGCPMVGHRGRSAT